MKNKLIAGCMLTVVGSLMMGPTILATSYESETNALSPVTVSIEEDTNTQIPPIDPADPKGPIDPVDPNPNVGSLAINYVSGLDFGEVTIDGKAQVIESAKDHDANDRDFDNLVSIRDIRNPAQRDGWRLTVKQTSELLEGATITMNPFIAKSVADSLEVSTSSEFIINKDAQVFAKTNSNTNPSGSLSIGMAQPNKSVTLSIPDGEYEAGNYSTSLSWELVSEPIGN